MKSMNDATSEIKPQALLDEFGEILGFVQTAFAQGRTAHEVETGLWERMLKLGRGLFGAWLELFGDGDAGDRLVLEDGREVRRLEALHRREIQNVFGPFALDRVVYGTREGQKIEAVPLDQRLGLPRGKNSYLLQDWDQHQAVEMPYATVSATLTRILGFTQSVHTLERNQREAATTTGEFWEAQPTPPSEKEGELLVCTADGKGVPMRGGAKAPKGIEPPSTAGMRPGTKKMALIGSVYTVNRFERTPDEVLEALFREAPVGQPPSRLRPCFKYVRAALERDDSDSTEPQTRTIFGWMAAQVRQRNPRADKHVVLLMDGQESLWKAGWAYLPEDACRDHRDPRPAPRPRLPVGGRAPVPSQRQRRRPHLRQSPGPTHAPRRNRGSDPRLALARYPPQAQGQAPRDARAHLWILPQQRPPHGL